MKIFTYIGMMLPLLLNASIGSEAVKNLLLNEKIRYTIGVSSAEPTTITFPGVITSISGANVHVEEKESTQVLISHTVNTNYFHLRAVTDEAKGALNILFRGKTYILSLESSESYARSVRFYEKVKTSRTNLGEGVGPGKLLELVDLAKQYHLHEQNCTELVQEVEHAFCCQQTNYKDFDVTIEEVFRFDAEDTLVFKVLLKNKTFKNVYYQPQRLAVRVGINIYYASIVDASGIIPGMSGTTAYFAITGSPSGGRANLCIENDFSVIVPRVEDVSLILTPYKSC